MRSCCCSDDGHQSVCKPGWVNRLYGILKARYKIWITQESNLILERYDTNTLIHSSLTSASYGWKFHMSYSSRVPRPHRLQGVARSPRKWFVNVMSDLES